MNKKRIYMIIGGAIIFLTSIIVGTFSISANNNLKSMFKEKDCLIGQGVIETKDISINTKIPGRIKKINVAEGQEVSAGDVLIEISNDELLAKKEQILAQIQAAQAGYDASVSQVEQAKAGYNASNALLSQALAGLNASKGKVTEASAGVEAAKKQQEITGATKSKADKGAREQEIAQAQAGYDLYKSTYQRVLNLYEKGAVSQQKLDEVKTQLKVSEQQLSMAQEGARIEDKNAAQSGVDMAGYGIDASAARVAQAKSGQEASSAQVSQAMAGLQASSAQLAMAQSGVDAKKALLDQANAGLQEIEAYLNDTKIVAPISGTVTTINSSEGELVSSGMSIATVSNLSSAWAEIKVKETDLEKISVGQNVKVKISSFPKEILTGKVVTINKKPDFATKRATNENGQFDIISFGVKIEFENSKEILRPGMTAFVQFEKQAVK